MLKKYRIYAYDVDYRNPKYCSIKSDVRYDPTPIDNAMYRLRFHGSTRDNRIKGQETSFPL